MIEAHVIFQGNVQGVFFRASARDIALDLELSGTVKNLPDGTVEMVAQGSEEEVKSLIEKLKQKHGLRDAESVSVTYRTIKSPLSEFRIIY